MAPRRRASLAVCAVGLFLCGIAFVIHSQLEYLSINGRAPSQPPSGTSTRGHLGSRSSSVVSRGCQSGTASQDPLQQGKAAFDELPEFARGAVVGLGAAFVYYLVPSLGPLFIILMGIYIFALDPTQKAEVDEAFQKLVGSFANGASGSYSPFAHSSSRMVELGSTGYMVGQQVEVRRSDETWSPAEVHELHDDGTMVVNMQLNGTVHTKTVYGAGVAKFVRRPVGDSVPALATATAEVAATGGYEDSDCTYAHAAMATTRTVGEHVEVLRSDKSWHPAIVSELMRDGSIMLTLEGGAGVKTVAEARLSSVVRSTGGLQMQFQPGRLMIEIQHETGMVVNVGPDGQAAHNGVKAGWLITRVNGQPFNFEAFYACASGNLPYTLSFDNV